MEKIFRLVNLRKKNIIEIANLNWASSQLLSMLDKIVLEQGFKHTVILNDINAVDAYNKIKTVKLPYLIPENWINNNNIKEENNIIVANKIPIKDVGEGWFINGKSIKNYPKIINMNVQQIIEHPEWFDGKIVICPTIWRGCNQVNLNLFKAFKMDEKGWEIVVPESGLKLDKTLESADRSNKSWFGHYWQPTTNVSKYNLKLLDFGVDFLGKEYWDNCIMKPDCKNPKPTSWLKTSVYSIVNQNFIKKFKVNSDEYKYIQNRTLDSKTVSDLLFYIEKNNTSIENTVIYFLKTNEEVWKTWVPDYITNNIKSYLSQIN